MERAQTWQLGEETLCGDLGLKLMNLNRDNLHRGAKILVDLQLAAGWPEALAKMQRYRFGIVVGPDAAASPLGQACLLTMVNAGLRSCPGGVCVTGLTGQERTLSRLSSDAYLAQSVCSLGGTIEESARKDMALICLGDATAKSDYPVMRVTFGGWSGGVTPEDSGFRLGEDSAFPAAAIAAAGLAVAECFSHLLGGNIMAGRRELGVSLLKPGSNWKDGSGTAGLYLPESLWLLGLGHLGQAFAWTLAAMPYPDGRLAHLVLQDTDTAKESNVSTSLLTLTNRLGHLKTRVVSAWLEERGFSTRLVEHTFSGDLRRAHNEPKILVCGVDNLPARRELERPGFNLAIDAGLGARASDYDGFCIQTFTDRGRAENAFPAPSHADVKSAVDANRAAYEGLGLDTCGMHLAADAAVGVPFVGVFVATLVLSEICRAISGECTLDTTAGSLSSINEVDAVSLGTRIRNPGYVKSEFV